MSAELLALADSVVQPGFEGTTVPDWLRRRLDDGLGSVLLFARNTVSRTQTRALTDALRSANPEVLIAVDEEGGDITRLEAAHGSSYPGNMALGVVDDIEATRAVARLIGLDLAEAGIGLDYAPTADVNSNPDNPVIGVRSFGADPELVATHTGVWIAGLHSAGVAACAKHFPGHGDTDVDSHHALPTVRASRDELAALALPPFRAAVAAGVRAVMAGHLLVPALDAGRPATLSRPVIDGLLRQELKFDGVVITDAMEMQAVARRYGLIQGPVLALTGGADLICLGSEAREPEVLGLRAAIVEAVRDGSLPEARLVEAATRVRRFAAWQRDLAARAAARAGVDEPALGLEVARRAVRVTTRRPVGLPGAAPLVAEFSTRETVVEGEGLSWGLVEVLGNLVPDAVGMVIGAGAAATPDRVAEVVRAAAGRPLVLVSRSAHRQPGVRAGIEAVLSQRPDAVHVELGFPGPELDAAATVWTHGASRVCRIAAAEAVARMLG